MVKNHKIAVVTLNWNGKDFVEDCLKSLLALEYENKEIIVIDNGSKDGSLDILRAYSDKLTLIEEPYNHGFAGGVNIGIRKAMEHGADFVALINNDATVDKNWLRELATYMNTHSDAAIVTSRLLTIDGKLIDSTGDFYTFWGLPYPRGRGETSEGNYLSGGEVFGASGGASLYRISALTQIGMFDEDFFAYFEDVDISFRGQLLGWHVYYCPTAIAYHHISGTSSKISGFGTYQTFKNFPAIYIKNMPFGLFWTHLLKVCITYFGLLFSAVRKGRAAPALKGFFMSVVLLPKNLLKRRLIQRSRVVSDDYLVSIINADPPQNQTGIWKVKRMLKI